MKKKKELTKFEKKLLKNLVKKELEHFSKEIKLLFIDTWPERIKGSWEYKKALERILKKLK